ncbi:MAG: hypothetical protein NTW96_24250 [Planctomycetia bacterium]|nr:hypothetical protein [Planctomycetia bacterium]
MAVASPLESCKVYTPSILARAMVSAIYEGGRQRWLEPSVGRGVFVWVLREKGVSKQRIVAVDLDTDATENDKRATVIRGVDFLEWSNNTRRRFDCVVGNPPFVSIRSLPSPFKEAAARVHLDGGRPIGLTANTWYAFLIRSVTLLKHSGNLAFVLPSACEYADYCQPGRNAIAQMFERTDLIRSRRPLFDGVQEGTAVLVCRNKGGGHGLFRRHEVDNLDGVIERLTSLDRRTARNCPNGESDGCLYREKLGSFIRIGVGGVTGDARFFVLTESQRREFGLPVRCLRPVVSRSRHVYRASMTLSDWHRLLAEDERVWLFDPPPSSLEHPAVVSYLRLKEGNGGCRRTAFKVRHRVPWYRTPMPRRPDGFVSGMTGLGVWICLNEMPRLNATNTLYVVHFLENLSRAEKCAWALSCLTTPAARCIRRATRVYADGLQKIEPGQLARIKVPRPPHLRNSVSLYRQALQELLDGNELGCRAIANDAVLNSRWDG